MPFSDKDNSVLAVVVGSIVGIVIVAGLIICFIKRSLLRKGKIMYSEINTYLCVNNDSYRLKLRFLC